MVKDELADRNDLELRARGITELLATALQGSLLVRRGPAAMSDAICASRLGPCWTGAFGTLPSGVDFEAVINRAAIG